jgi:DNA-binding NtrC family response regulator
MLSDKLERLVEDMVEKGVRFDDAVREFEKRYISRVLGQCDGSVTRAADALGVHRNTLSRKILDYKIRKRTA